MFNRTIHTREALQELVGTPSNLAVHKVIDSLDRHCEDFIAKSPLLLLATADKSGSCDVSPRGDQPGFVSILNQKHLLIPERRGNKRIDSLYNILENPHVGLIFLIPGLRETLRVNGKASIVTDEELLAPLAVSNTIPLAGIGVEVEECFLHCGKAMIRSNLWNPAAWLLDQELPRAAEILAAHAKITTQTEIETSLNEGYRKRLY
ncbi:phosphohydrolase [Pradoshia eiseniae]|uniref:Phosphohydrolase n=1 Tax=Pradoshia eiseniae TaxID=2064768 RepID=A0A2S7N0U8_9BACI|nr:pyridoxamine 5'-phosphate oxidase family protein [Pradoshia eiseniae]PQD95712.1 phosphohydrolase [Pradoshia eiseniae]